MRRSISRLSAAVTAAAVLALAGSAYAQATAGDKYLCWQAKLNKKFPNVPAKGLPITVKDQFDAAVHNYELKDNSALCTPVLPAVNDPNIHYVQYPVKDLKTPKFVSPTTIYNVSDMFVSNVQIKKLKPVSIMVRSSKLSSGAQTKCKVIGDPCPVGTACNVTAGYCVAGGATPTVPAAPAGTTLNNYMCYQPTLVVKPDFKVPPFTSVEAADQFGNWGPYALKKITKLCAPANKDDETPGAETHAIHLLCYQAKLLPKPKPPKFTAAVNNTNVGNQWVTPQKVVELCAPAIKSTAPITTPTELTTTALAAGGVCGSITAGAGVPGRVDPADALTDPNAACTGAGAPEACCTAAGAGHCHVATTVTCGTLTFGGGGKDVADPGDEEAQEGGTKTRYTLTCMGPTDTACAISGNVGDQAAGILCSTAGCSGVTPIEVSSPPPTVCAITKLAVDASGTLDLVNGKIAFPSTNAATINIFTTTSTGNGCPRCRVGGTATTFPEATAVGSTPGVGVCDSDSHADSVGDTCYVWDPGAPGLSSDCKPVAAASPVLTITTNSSSDGDSVTHPDGNFCQAFGQGGNPDCTGPDTPQGCCTGPGTGSGCFDFRGCFGSANASGVKFADAPGVCTGISVTGNAVGPLLAGTTVGPATYGDVACIPAIPDPFGGAINPNAGLPGPVLNASKTSWTID